mmetsp:Transcript_37428/g.81804  ORF Transcript_37428/g.81804 Transcript_37428/m.81804 type:complete len:575 (+) Transcript_37428:37-1761(+)|eukprot:CAMPEP_0204285962 /NCGR_PEP_ID=MMETSP0468-20130131/51783_1 /ASSEMBLY_ACC=CAM_ASM_000383 /TAXON_ID=2969 /ORGANISM="Oxyrrhis marina" /LENGTH=574 /DNA_ID=CAMNT_0051263829 /DNA_START=26 /DNA_END=1750 /DNA_ORIENTATION=-
MVKVFVIVALQALAFSPQAAKPLHGAHQMLQVAAEKAKVEIQKATLPSTVASRNSSAPTQPTAVAAYSAPAHNASRNGSSNAEVAAYLQEAAAKVSQMEKQGEQAWAILQKMNEVADDPELPEKAHADQEPIHVNSTQASFLEQTGSSVQQSGSSVLAALQKLNDALTGEDEVFKEKDSMAPSMPVPQQVAWAAHHNQTSHRWTPPPFVGPAEYAEGKLPTRLLRHRHFQMPAWITPVTDPISTGWRNFCQGVTLVKFQIYLLCKHHAFLWVLVFACCMGSCGLGLAGWLAAVAAMEHCTEAEEDRLRRKMHPDPEMAPCEAVCRICHEDGEGEEGPLIRPCKCSGSVQYVHRTCLDMWRASGVNPRSMARCEMCHYTYKLRRLDGQEVRHAEAAMLCTMATQLILVVVAFAGMAWCLSYPVIDMPWVRKGFGFDEKHITVVEQAVAGCAFAFFLCGVWTTMDCFVRLCTDSPPSPTGIPGHPEEVFTRDCCNIWCSYGDHWNLCALLCYRSVARAAMGGKAAMSFFFFFLVLCLGVFVSFYFVFANAIIVFTRKTSEIRREVLKDYEVVEYCD